MPLVKAPVPKDLLTVQQRGTAGVLNSQSHPDFSKVRGQPTLDLKKPQWDAAAREALAALILIRKLAGEGLDQFLYLGEDAVRFLYGRAKQQGEQDCDVIARVLDSASYGYWLGEGKGADLLKAKAQFDTACGLLAGHRTQPGPVCGAVIVMPRLRYLEWMPHRDQWVAFLDAKEEMHITERLQPSIALSKPALQTDKIYLLDGPDDRLGEHSLPIWCIHNENQPYTVWVHYRVGGNDRGSFRPLAVGQGRMYLYYVAS